MTGTRTPPPPLKKDTEERYQFYRFPVEHAFRMTNGLNEYRFDLILDTQTNQVIAPLYSIGQMAMVNDRTPGKWLNKLCPGSAIRIQIQVPCSVAQGGWYTFQCHYSEQIAIFLKRYNHPWTQCENPAQNVNEELLKFIQTNEAVALYPITATHAQVEVIEKEVPSTLPSTVPSTLPVEPIVEQDVKQLDLLEGLKSNEEGSQVEELTTMFYHNHRIEQRKTDGYVNATQMCQANGKLIGDWLRTQDCERYLAAFSTSMGIPIDLLIITTTDGPNELRGTWIHPELAVKLGRWISVEFEIWCDQHIKTLMTTGSTSLSTEAPPTPAEALLQTAQTLVDYEKRLLKLERNYVQDRAEREASRKALLALPTSDKEAPEFTDRMKVRSLIESRAGYDGAEYKACWRRLYRQYEMTCQCNLKARMNYSGCSTKLEQIELDGGMETLFAIATELFAMKEVD